ncbi:MAG: aminodeoxychorismate synthase component I [Candidatus Omnitrophica bacterium]|nr:aminodeoxychorismate synthase component I [Candidatus Omnitrophota bacterium]
MRSRTFPAEKVNRILNASLGEPFVFLETGIFSRENSRSFFFGSFVDILKFHPGDCVDTFFKKIEDRLRQGYWICGFFSYELGYFLERKLAPCRDIFLGYPLAWIGVCRRPVRYTHPLRQDDSKEDFTHPLDFDVHPNITQKEYIDSIAMIKDYLEQGETYQVNYTFKLKSECFDYESVPLYLSLRKAQPTSYSAFIHTEDRDFLSFSPELFFRTDRRRIITRPMKGTIQRGRYLEEDVRYEDEFLRDTKIKAENLMIVDLLRNDLGKIAQKGTVKVEDLFTIEKYQTLYQMTSTVSARVPRQYALKDIFTALFPSGSVTGAPKIRTMQLIRDLEREARGIYTGAIGYLGPQGQGCFNVAIRTLVVDPFKKNCEIGIGGGIVYDSVDTQEFKEALLKADFFLKIPPDFSLIETIRWHNGCYLLDGHLARLKKSCAYFGFEYNENKIKRHVKRLKRFFEEGVMYKIKVEVDRTGKITSTFEIIDEIAPAIRVKISDKIIDPGSCFLYHKTTERLLYDSERNKALSEGFFDVLFFNRYGQLTEGAVTNVYIEKDQNLFTPPLSCGVLPGVLREELLRQGKAQEKIMYREDIVGADKIYVGNSVRGLLAVEEIEGLVRSLQKTV